ncbi:MAG: hypothetical protein JRN62_02335 [Nitrososphaerota archaeon]|jgi:hypothetical protein|nr:hypothetical protein [Nitrososphaerota archaeon]MDG6948850.1 hypothetical protein [Nitrososphaerota archaeon]
MNIENRLGRGHKGVAGILAAVLMFAMLFTAGLGFFVYVNKANALYDQQLVNSNNAVVAAHQEDLAVTTGLSSSSLTVTIQNKGSAASQVVDIFVTEPSGSIVQLTGTSTTPSLPITINAGTTSPTLVTNIIISSGNYYVKVLTGRGNTFTSAYPTPIPPYAQQAESSGSLAINLQTFRFYVLGTGMQSGGEVSGFVATALPITSNDIAFSVTFTNTDIAQRNITIWPSSEVEVMTIQAGSNGKNIQTSNFFIASGLTGGTDPTGIAAFTTPLTVAYQHNVTLYFGASSAEGTGLISTSALVQSPFTAFFELNGIYSDGTFFGETVPFPAGTVTLATASTSSTAAAPGSIITVSGTGFTAGAAAFIGWLTPSTESFTTLTTFTVVASGGTAGDIPSGVTFPVPSVAAGYYVVVVSDYISTSYIVFQVT